jgi:hypothetical protein
VIIAMHFADALSCSLDTILVQLCVMIFMIVLQESGMTLVTAEDLDDAAEKAVKASVK